jgi:hypothetical protein
MHHPPTFWKFASSEQKVSPFEMRLLTVLAHNTAEEVVLETHAMTITDQTGYQKRRLECKIQNRLAPIVVWET